MFKVLDTFAGAGGFSLGFENAGYNIFGAIEIDKWACDTFKYNHSESIVLQENIELLSDEEIKKSLNEESPDVILGGPPCQGFSICNKDAGDPKDPRNSLFTEFIRMGELFDPKIMVMENVPNILRAKTKQGELVIDIITKELEELNFHVYKKVLHATDFGVPQIRKRLFVIASKIELEKPFPTPTHYYNNGKNGELFKNNLPKTPTLWEAISDLPSIKAREGAEEMEYENSAKNEYQAKLRNESDLVYNHKAMRHSKRIVKRFKSMTWGDSVEDVPDHLKPNKRNGNGKKSKKTYSQNNRRMHPKKPCHTIPASFYANFVHPYKHRNFTAREGARIQSFPDKFKFLGKPTVVSKKLLTREGRHNENYLCQYNQIGNAVPPLLGKAIANNLKSSLTEIKEEKVQYQKV